MVVASLAKNKSEIKTDFPFCNITIFIRKTTLPDAQNKPVFSATSTMIFITAGAEKTLTKALGQQFRNTKKQGVQRNADCRNFGNIEVLNILYCILS